MTDSAAHRPLVPVVGVAAFTLLMPVTGAILLVLVLLTLCYSDAVMIYTRADGSHVVAREKLGPDINGVAAVAHRTQPTAAQP